MAGALGCVEFLLLIFYLLDYQYSSHLTWPGIKVYANADLHAKVIALFIGAKISI